jgi:FkbM family methyltransferase
VDEELDRIRLEERPGRARRRRAPRVAGPGTKALFERAEELGEDIAVVKRRLKAVEQQLRGLERLAGETAEIRASVAAVGEAVAKLDRARATERKAAERRVDEIKESVARLDRAQTSERKAAERRVDEIKESVAGLDRAQTSERKAAERRAAEQFAAFERTIARLELAQATLLSSDHSARAASARVSFASTPELSSLLDRVDVKLVDIGARGDPKKEMVALAPVAHLFACEPEEKAAKELEGELRLHGWRDVTILTEAIASSEGKATLYETSKPGWTSLLEPDREVASQYLAGGSFDVVAQSKVPTITLDAAAARYGFEDACFLKIDTQGTELDILQSGSNLLDRSIVGVYLEANFKPFYRGQSLFADTDAFLREHGFTLLELHRTQLRRRGFSDEVYSKRHAVWAHCLYVRDADLLAERGEEAAPLLLRYVALCLAYVHHDLALAAVGVGKPAELLEAAYGPELKTAVEEHVRKETKRRLRGVPAEERAVLLGRAERE